MWKLVLGKSMYIPKWHLWLNVFTFSETQLYNEGRKTEPRGGKWKQRNGSNGKHRQIDVDTIYIDTIYLHSYITTDIYDSYYMFYIIYSIFNQEKIIIRK